MFDALDRMVRELAARKPGAHLIEGSLRRVPLPPHVEVRGADAGPRRFARALAGEIDRHLDDLVQHAAAFRPGRVHCHRCESSVCDHSLPPSCRHVFVRYANTGLPVWEDFAQFCLDRRHPQVDRLFDSAPAFITVFLDRESLHGGLIDAFRNDRYELLGQVTAGFYPAPGRRGEGRTVIALSLQAAATRSSAGQRLQVGLNLLGRAPDGGALEDLWERYDDLPWRRAIGWAQTALATVAPRGRRPPGNREGPEARLEQRVDRILLGLSRRLERERRARTRRTRHAELRHASGRRPTRKAIDDAREVRPENVCIDDKSGTLVVLGERGRTHFFTPAGQHVSSVRYAREAIERKLRRELWRPAAVAEVEGFKAALAATEGGP